MDLIITWLREGWFRAIALLEIQAKVFGQRLLHDIQLRGRFAFFLFYSPCYSIRYKFYGR